MRSPWGGVQAPGERGGRRQSLAAEEQRKGKRGDGRCALSGRSLGAEGPGRQGGAGGGQANQAEGLVAAWMGAAVGMGASAGRGMWLWP